MASYFQMQTKGHGSSLLINDGVVDGSVPVSRKFTTARTLIVHAGDMNNNKIKNKQHKVMLLCEKCKEMASDSCSRKGKVFVCVSECLQRRM